jgi:hypothetical protein
LRKSSWFAASIQRGREARPALIANPAGGNPADGLAFIDCNLPEKIPRVVLAGATPDKKETRPNHDGIIFLLSRAAMQ